MQIALDEEMRTLLNELKWFDWHETYNCAIKRDINGHTQAVLVVTGSLYMHLQSVAEIQIDYWSIGDLLTELLTSIAHGFPMETVSNRYVVAILEAIKIHHNDTHNITWTTWETS